MPTLLESLNQENQVSSNSSQAARQKVSRQIDKLVSEEFFVFLFEKWRISSGEHLGERYSVADRPYMLEIIKDDFPFQITMKSAQCGISEIEIAKSIFEASCRKRNVLYTMSAGEQMEQFVDARARNAILNNEFLRRFVSGSLNLKKFALSGRQIYFRGVQKRRQIITVDVSTLRADEVDSYEDQRTLYTLNKRLGASTSPVREYFSTPSFHGIGISLYYFGSEANREKGSDQRVWTIKCERCGQWNEDLLWFENIVDLNDGLLKYSNYEPNVIVICRHCKKELNRLSSNAEWVAKHPELSLYCHGRHISKLFSPVANLNQMMEDSRNPLKEQEFFNSDLGLPYEPKGSRLTDEILNNCRADYGIIVKGEGNYFMGGDIGKAIHCVVSEETKDKKPKIVAAYELEDWHDLGLIWNDFKPRCTILDANPDKREAIDFQKKHPNVLLGYYIDALERTVEKFVIKQDDDGNDVINIHRTLLMQIVSDIFINKNILLPRDIKIVRDFFEHLKAPIKAQKQNDKGDWITWYPKTSMPDHYYHAVLYDLLAHMVQPGPAIFKIVKTLFS